MGKIIVYKGNSQYNVLSYFAENLYKELRKIRETILVDLTIPDFDKIILKEFESKVDLTIGFNIWSLKTTYCNLKIPHMALIVDHPIYHSHCFDLNSDYLYMGCTDEERLNFLQTTLDFKNSFIFHHAVDSEIKANIDGEKNYDIVMLGGVQSSNKIRTELKQKYREELFEIIDYVSEIACNNSIFSIEDLFDSAIQKKNIKVENVESLQVYYNLITDIEKYVRNISREKAIKCFSKFNIHIFGNVESEAFNNSEKIIVHKSVDNMEALEILKRSKVSLNSTKSIFNGSHERPLLSGACGAVLLTNKTDYFKNLFGDTAVYYNDCILNEAYDEIEELLKNDKLRTAKAIKANEIVMENHTWKNRAEQIISML